jgi:hypothetical protein
MGPLVAGIESDGLIGELVGVPTPAAPFPVER